MTELRNFIRNSRIPYYAIVYSFASIFLNTVALKPLADSVWAITLKLEFAAGFVILSLTPSTDVLKVS